VVQHEAFLEDLRSRDSALPDRVIGMALASCDVVLFLVFRMSSWVPNMPMWLKRLTN